MTIAIIAMLFPPSVTASPWVQASEVRVRQNLEYLNDAGVLPTPVTTWPVMWSDVKAALGKVNWLMASTTQKRALRELMHELRYQSDKGFKRSLNVSASNSRNLLTHSGSYFREKGELHHRLSWDGENVAFQLQGNITTDPGRDDIESQLDGSYVAAVIGNWVIGAGAIDRWWGPGSNSSLIMSNNARPIPAAMFRTRGEQTFDSSWLSWLGSWQFVSFVGQLESSRHISEAKITGMRFTIRPMKGLELGASRAMQWGGKGRSQGLSAFFKSLTSQDENTSDGSGNQLGGFDFRYGRALTDYTSATIYGQAIGEDEAGYMPSKFTSQFGLEAVLAFDGSGSYLKGFIEYLNTTAGSFNEAQYNTAYSHSIYKTGYRFRGRVLGASYDNDSKVISAGVSLNRGDNQSYSLVVNDMQLNTDNAQGDNVISLGAQDLYRVELNYQTLFIAGRLSLGMSYLSEELVTANKDFEQGALFAGWEYRF